MSLESEIDDALASHAAVGEWAGVITGWVMLVSTVEVDEIGERSGVAQIYPGGSMPWIQALGIIEAARIRMHDDFRREA
jgi:hypothetical protein